MSESLDATRSGTTAFGTALRSMRLAAGLSQGALAERAGLSEKAVGALERGDRTTPRLATLALLADALGASPADRDRLLAAAHAEQRPTASARPTDTGAALLDGGQPADAGAASLLRHGLPVPPTPLLGRQQDIAAVSQLVSPPAVRPACSPSSVQAESARLASHWPWRSSSSTRLRTTSGSSTSARCVTTAWSPPRWPEPSICASRAGAARMSC